MKYKITFSVLFTVSTILLYSQNLIVEKGGITIIEAEDLQSPNGWQIGNTIQGFSGEGYLVCTTDNMDQPNEDHQIRIKIIINHPGTYIISLRNIHLHPRRDLWNDCWIKADGTKYYKLYSSWDQKVGDWGWDSHILDYDNDEIRFDKLKVYWDTGIHEIIIGARSKNFIFDRIAIYNDEKKNIALDLNTPVSTTIGQQEYLNQKVTISGSLKKWQPMQLSFKGPKAKESDAEPNPFLDYRLQVEFKGPQGQKYNVPGYFDGDGKGNGTGNIWSVNFSPDQIGAWKYKVTFRKGKKIAISSNPHEGQKATLDGLTGKFKITQSEASDPYYYRMGRLEHVGKFYFKFRDGPYWLKGGVDSPEDFLAYAGFDNTPQNHYFKAHTEDWKFGDPDWNNGSGKAIIGSLNYLASKNVNSLYFLTMNIGGDGHNVWPWLGRPVDKPRKKLEFDTTNVNPDTYDNLHFDISKLSQWVKVFEHAQNKGIMLHFVLNEAERANKLELDSGKLGVERKLFYREHIARFGHFPALIWNLCEEYNIELPYKKEDLIAFAQYIKTNDPYKHPITVHHAGDPLKAIQFIFENDLFDCTSIQPNMTEVGKVTEELRSAAKKGGNIMPVMLDEFSVAAGQVPYYFAVNNADLHRKEKIWPIYLSGGQPEFILEELLNTESFKTPQLDKLWDYTWYARKFMKHIPFQEMEPADSLVNDEEPYMVGVRPRDKKINVNFEQLQAQVYAKTGEAYAIYLPKARYTGYFNTTGFTEDLSLIWFNPRTGIFEGDPKIVKAGEEKFDIGLPPYDIHEDWVVLIKDSFME